MKLWHALKCRIGKHRRLRISDHRDPCIYCEMDEWLTKTGRFGLDEGDEG